MSNPRAKAARSAFKDARQIPIQDEVKLSRSKKKKPFKLLYRHIGRWKRFGSNGWVAMGHYRTEDVAKKVIADHHRKFPDYYEFKLEVMG